MFKRMTDFGQIPTDVICRFGELTKTEIIVLSYLYAARNGKSGQCNPKQKAIAEDTKIHKSHISRAIKSLEFGGWILEVDGGNFLLKSGAEKLRNTQPVEVAESATESCEIGNSLNKERNIQGTEKEHTKNIKTEVVEVFEFWQTTLDHPTARLTSEREKKIKARLKAGYSVDQIKSAILGCKLSPHHQGQNDRAQIYDDLELICRDDTKLEKFIDYGRKPKGENGKPTNGRTGNSAILNEWAEFARSG